MSLRAKVASSLPDVDPHIPSCHSSATSCHSSATLTLPSCLSSISAFSLRCFRQRSSVLSVGHHHHNGTDDTVRTLCVVNRPLKKKHGPVFSYLKSIKIQIVSIWQIFHTVHQEECCLMLFEIFSFTI